jgi:hypothetical protein
MSATPSRRRMGPSQSHPSTQSPSTSRRQPSSRSYTYQPPEAPLTLEGQRQLTSLLQSSHLRNIRTHLQHATEKLAQSGGEVNERLADARTRYEKDKERRRRQGGGDVEEGESDPEYQRLAKAETKVEAITAQLEEQTRSIVDAEVRLETLTNAIGELERVEGEAVTAAMGTRQTRAQRLRQMATDGEGDDDSNDHDYEDAQEREAAQRNAQHPPSRRLGEQVAEEVEKWNELSLTERYAF